MKLIRRQACPGCRSTDAKVLYSCPFDLGAFSVLDRDPVVKDALVHRVFELLECAGCGLVFQREIPDAELSDRIYGDAVYEDPWDGYRHDESLMGSPLALLGISLELLRVLFYLGRHPSQVSMLDVGMGWGVAGRVAIGYGCRAYGVEVSRPKLRVAESFGVTPITIDDAIDQGLRFEFVNIDQVLEHVAEPLTMVEQVAPLLAGDGVMKLSVPNIIGARRLLKEPDWKRAGFGMGKLNVFAPLEHINSFSGQALRAMGARVGLVPIRVPEVATRRLPGSSVVSRLEAPLKSVYGKLYYWSSSRSTHLFFRHA